MKDLIIMLLFVTNVITGVVLYQNHEKYSKYDAFIEKIESSEDVLKNFQKDFKSEWNKLFDK